VTGVVALRRWRETDLECVAAAAEDPRIPAGTTVPATYTPEAGRAFIARQWQRETDGEGRSRALAVDDRAVGLVWIAFRPQPRVAGLGYWVIPAERGRGYGTRGAQLAAEWALTHGFARIEAWVAPDNVASQRLLRSAGFEREGVLRAFLDGKDAVVFSRVVSHE
jgi:RimJ/RimL family protein N-acetyltransferase